MTTRTALIGYALSFASFLVDSGVGKEINKIILFGSVARGDFTEKSDIDLFINADEQHEEKIEKTLLLFNSSQIHKMWRLKGVKQEISLKIGRLNQWSLRREVLSSGIVLYGKHSELPEKARYYLLVRMELVNIKVSQQMKIWRKLYGYVQKIGEKKYVSAGLVEKIGGKKLGKGIIIIPMEKRQEILDFLNKNKVKYKVHELWSDSF